VLALGGPHQAFPAGGWDFLPVFIAVAALVGLKVWLHVRITPVVVLVTVLAAPLYRAAADAVGFPLAVMITLVVAGFFAAAGNARRAPRTPPTDV
jgi:hypothetical protein